MDRATYKMMMALGVLLNSALYLAGALWLGVQLHNVIACRFALAALAVTYLSYAFHFAAVEKGALQAWAVTLVYISIILGAGAGVALLLG